MSYKVLRSFFDLKDGNFRYSKGDTFPRKGKTASQERLEGLLSANNPGQAPFIELERDEEEKVEEEKKPKTKAKARNVKNEAKEKE